MKRAHRDSHHYHTLSDDYRTSSENWVTRDLGEKVTSISLMAVGGRVSSPDGLTENTPSAWRAGTLELGTMDTEKTTGMGLRFTSLTFLVAVWFTLSAPKLTVLCAGLTNSICRNK